MKNNSTKMKVHFMGIGGSGISAAALLAKKYGFEITGCDLEKVTPYAKKLLKQGIKVFRGHDKKHLESREILVVTPAVYYTSSNHPEFVEAKKESEVLTWQEFVGKYLQVGKEVISISGTHGKSTTTAFTALVFEKANFDPSVIVGATVPDWGANFRIGKSKLFVIEADEFFDNFQNYLSDAIIINNIEFDHPDYFKDERSILESFKKFVLKSKGSKTLIVNIDSEGVVKLIKSLQGRNSSRLSVYGYTLKQVPQLDLKNIVYGSITERNPELTEFVVYSNEPGIDEHFKLKIPGDHNVSNALGVITLAKLFNIDFEVVKSVLSTFNGVGRRLELIGEKRGIKVFDDYAHHPTAIKATISGLRQRYPANKLWAIIEPHSFSRTHALLKDYDGVFVNADEVIVGPIFKARDTKTFGINGDSIVKVAGHKNAKYLESTVKITKYVKKGVNYGDVILVMGAGKSYLWANEILKKL